MIALHSLCPACPGQPTAAVRSDASGCAPSGASLFLTRFGRPAGRLAPLLHCVSFARAKKSQQKKHAPTFGQMAWVSACWPSHFLLLGQEKVTKEKATPTGGPALRAGCVHSITTPRVGIHGPSMARYASRGRPGRSSLCVVNPFTRLKGGEVLPDSIGITANDQAARTCARPVGRVQVSRRLMSALDGRERLGGAGTPLPSRWPERRRSEGSLFAQRTDPNGRGPFFFGSFLLGQARRKELGRGAETGVLRQRVARQNSVVRVMKAEPRPCA